MENQKEHISFEQVIEIDCDIDILIKKVARGGNLLLNIGPTVDGRIPVIMQQHLADMRS